MSYFGITLQQTCIMLLMISVGFALHRLKLLTKAGNAALAAASKKIRMLRMILMTFIYDSQLCCCLY